MYRRYRIVDERDLREATARLQAHLDEQPKKPDCDTDEGRRIRKHGQKADNFTEERIRELLNGTQVIEFLVEPKGIEPSTS